MKTKTELNYIRSQSRQIFDRVKGDWINYGRWTLPHRTRWMQSQVEGRRNNHIIVDTTHVLALRSFVAGFLEGNTSASRQWYRFGSGNRDIDLEPENHKWLDFFNRRTHRALNITNFYHSAGIFYYDFGTFNTGAHYIEEVDDSLFWHVLTPGSYYVINNGYGEATMMVREFSLRVKAVVDQYGVKKENGGYDLSNISSSTRKMYDDSNYEQFVDIAQVIMENEDFDPSQPVGGPNRQWVSYTYECGGVRGSHISTAGMQERSEAEGDDGKYLRISYSKRKPFIVGKSDSSTNFEYGEKGPTSDALGLIKSLNKKAISKDRALEQMVSPAVQGPASLRKSYVTTAANKFVPLDPTSDKKGGLRRIFEISPAIGALIQDVEDIRKAVDRHYYADFLLYLTKNPKTRTATETDAILTEQQRVIGPNLQSLNWTYNIPVAEFVADWVLDNDSELPPVPKGLQGRTLRPEFISVFAQAQRAADLPAIDRYVQMVGSVAQMNASVLQKVNLDKLADLYEDRLYLPEGLNRGQEAVEVMREQAQAEARRKEELEALTQVSAAAKNMSSVNQNPNQGEQE